MNQIQQIALKDIKIPPRVRKDLGDISGLKESIRKFGLINPIVVDQNLSLIAGQRRFEAVRQLGYDFIDVRVLISSKKDLPLKLELEENLHRKDFLLQEYEEGITRLKKLERPSIFARLWHWLKSLFRRSKQ